MMNLRRVLIMSLMNASAIFNANQLQEMEEYISLNNQIKELEQKKKALSENVKQYMIDSRYSQINVNNSTLTLIESERKTVTKSTKDKFIADLVGMGKKHLVNYSIEPDVDSIYAEVDAGSLDKDFVDQYIKKTPVTTLRCN